MTIGVAVIGAGMAGRAHAAAYRIAPTLYASTLPPLRFVSIADVSPEFGSLAARRFGYERSDTSWQAIAENPEHPRGQRGGGQLPAPRDRRGPAGGRKARALREAAQRHPGGCPRHGRGGPTRRHGRPHRLHLPPGAGCRRTCATWCTSGALGRSCTSTPGTGATTPAIRRDRSAGATRAPPGSGALADIGSHAAYLAEFLCGDIQEVSGGRFATAITEAAGAAGCGDRARSGRGQRRVRGRSRTTTTPASAPSSRTVPASSRSPGSPPAIRTASPSRSSATRAPQVGAGATGRVPAHAQRGTGGSPRLPARDHRPGPPVRRRRTADGRARGRLRPERRVRLPGPRLPGRGRRHRRGRFAAPLRVLRRGRAQHGDPRRRRRLRRSRRGVGQGAAHASQTLEVVTR